MAFSTGLDKLQQHSTLTGLRRTVADLQEDYTFSAKTECFNASCSTVYNDNERHASNALWCYYHPQHCSYTGSNS